MQTLDYLHEVRQGNPSLLAGLFEKALMSQQVAVGGRRDAEDLHLLFEAGKPLDPDLLYAYVRSAFLALNLSPRTVHLYGRLTGQEVVSWQRQMAWSATPGMDQEPSPPPLDVPAGMEVDDPDGSEIIELEADLEADLSIPDSLRQADLSIALASAAIAPTPAARSTPWLPRLLLGLAILGCGSLGIWFYQRNLASTPSPAVSGETTPLATPAPAALLNQALKTGWQAALAAQKAKTAAEWDQVAQHWQSAIAQLKALPSQGSEAQAIQLKIREYQGYLAIALKKKQQAAISQ